MWMTPPSADAPPLSLGFFLAVFADLQAGCSLSEATRCYKYSSRGSAGAPSGFTYRPGAFQLQLQTCGSSFTALPSVGPFPPQFSSALGGFPFSLNLKSLCVFGLSCYGRLGGHSQSEGGPSHVTGTYVLTACFLAGFSLVGLFGDELTHFNVLSQDLRK